MMMPTAIKPGVMMILLIKRSVKLRGEMHEPATSSTSMLSASAAPKNEASFAYNNSRRLHLTRVI